MCQPWLAMIDCPVNAFVGNAARNTAIAAMSATVVNSPSTVVLSMTPCTTACSLMPIFAARSGICCSINGVRTNPGQIMFERTP